MMPETQLVRNERLKALGLMFHQLAVAIFIAAVAVPIAAALTTDGSAIRYLAAAPFGLLLTSACVMIGQRILGDLKGWPAPIEWSVFNVSS